MSIPVAVSEIGEQMERFGHSAFVISASSEGHPHLIDLTLSYDGETFGALAGNTCARNVRERPEITMLWPAYEPDGYSMVANATATVNDENRLTMTPLTGILHRPASRGKS